MPAFTYLVTVDTASQEQADRVLAERLNYDEDYGFSYDLSSAPVPLVTAVMTTAGSTATGSQSAALDERPRTDCACGYELVWVDGEWQHDAAPFIWGDDHDPHPEAGNEEPADLQLRCHWDSEDCLSQELRASALCANWLFREYGTDEWYRIQGLSNHGDAVLITAADGTDLTLDADTLVEAIETR